MDMKELTAFQTILKEGSFAKAAAKLNYAQSTITNQIQRLEKELGFQLFHRGWEAKLTPAGELYAAEVEQLIAHWHYAAERAKAISQEDAGTLRVGFLEMLGQQVMPQVMRRFHESKPGVTCQFVVGNTDQLSAALRQGELDFAVCGEPVELSDFRFEPLYKESIEFITSEDHPLQLQDGDVPFKSLLQYPLFVGGPTCLYYLYLWKYLARYETMPLLHSVTQISAIPAFIRETPYVGAVLGSTALPPSIKPIAVDWDHPAIPVGVLTLRDNAYPRAARERFVELTKEIIYPSSEVY
ncbi:LysR family transcriptional regulator [Paenibacillus glycanilyticus]|uniref:HTH-type transcriptional regulator YtlI n=1 Tax=Paenibacillus glycanilyticus TaxID=126569 RepID=A0ABQ6GIE6_9BACL|nr:LysR family transcriptional regulator [Paenibacillus glycanilyticus]GLX70275.1 HTH-type transcriptional regulator YtlI [Paenibacillus glycanilyticus]